MAHKRKRVVRRKTPTTKGKKHETKKRSRSKADARKTRVARNVAPKRKAASREKRNQRSAKTPKRKHAARKPSKARQHAKRPELLLTPFVDGFGGGLDAITGGIGGGISSAERTQVFPPGPIPVSRDAEDEDDEEFIGPIGDSYDDDFGDIDWSSFDWDDVYDDIGDEEVDSYAESTK